MDYYFVRLTFWLNCNTIPSRLLFNLDVWITYLTNSPQVHLIPREKKYRHKNAQNTRFTTIAQNKEVHKMLSANPYLSSQRTAPNSGTWTAQFWFWHSPASISAFLSWRCEPVFEKVGLQAQDQGRACTRAYQYSWGVVWSSISFHPKEPWEMDPVEYSLWGPGRCYYSCQS